MTKKGQSSLTKSPFVLMMTDVAEKEELVGITFRLSDSTLEKLKRHSVLEKTKVASILRRLANRYVAFGRIAERRREFSMPRTIVNILFSELSDEQKKAIEDEYYLIALNDLKARYTEINCTVVESALLSWARFNDLHFNIERGSSDFDFWVLCQHAFGKNWAVLIGNVITRLLQYNNECMIVKQDSEIDDHVLRIHYRFAQNPEYE